MSIGTSWASGSWVDGSWVDYSWGGVLIVYGFGDIVLTNQAVNVANLTLTDVWVVLPSCTVDGVQNSFSAPDGVSVSFSESNSVSIAMEPVL